MNVQLNETEEFINGKSTGTLGQVLIRYATEGVQRGYSAVERILSRGTRKLNWAESIG